jgi:D-alanyl-D-alanine carboxypeptidase (penicillin-binding protein 5/6)
MIWKHRGFVVVIVAAATLVGIAAGLKLAQIEQDEKYGRINITIQKPDNSGLSQNNPIQISKNFYKPTAPTTPKNPVISAPAKPAAPTDGVTAESYIVGNLDTGDVYLERNADAVLPFASMSKLITALVETNIYAKDASITIPELSDDISMDLSGIHTGETFTAQELIYPLLMTSSNIVAEAFARSATTTTRGEFLSLMNGYSWEIGMPHAHFADPSGLDSGNSGTARGFLAMAQYLYKSRSDILAITRTPLMNFATTTEHEGHALVNIHPFAADSRFLGGKTGHTSAALDTMLTILNINGHPVAFIVLRSQNRTKDTQQLILNLSKRE